jgi:hypothetical protein
LPERARLLLPRDESTCRRGGVSNVIPRPLTFGPGILTAALPADWHLFTIEVEGAAFHDYDPQEDVHHVKKWTPARGYEASTRSITT